MSPWAVLAVVEAGTFMTTLDASQTITQRVVEAAREQLVIGHLP